MSYGQAIAGAVGSVGSAWAAIEDAKTKAKARLRAYKKNKKVLRQQLTVARNRVDISLSEATRDKVRTGMAVRAAAGKARGEVRVQAAQMGRTGKRARLSEEREIGMQEADVISDAAINEEIQKTNIINQYNDAAINAIQQFNEGIPGSTSTASMLAGLTDVMTQQANMYGKMSTAQQADLRNSFRGLFSGSSPTGSSSNVDQTYIGGR